MDLTPNDVTAVARAGLINVKMNRYETACCLLRSLSGVDRRGLVYVLKAVDSGRRKRLAEVKLGDQGAAKYECVSKSTNRLSVFSIK